MNLSVNAKKYFPFFLVLFEVAAYLSNDMYLPALPSLAREFDVSSNVVQYTLASWFIGACSLQLIVGPLSDKIGNRIVLLFTAINFIVSSLICALTQNIDVFIVTRFFQGMTVCGVIVAGYALIHKLYDQTQAIQVLAVMSSITLLAPALGPIVGAIIVQFLDWRVIFWLFVVMGVLSYLLLSRVLPKEHIKPAPMSLKSILSDYIAIVCNLQFLRYAIPYCLVTVGFFAWIVESPFVIIDHYGYSEIYFGLAQCLVFGGFILGTRYTKHLIANHAPSAVIRRGFSIALIGSIAFLTVNLFHLPLIASVCTMVITAFGAAMNFGPLNRLAVESCSQPMGSRMAIISSIMSVGGAIASILVTYLSNESFTELSACILVNILIAISLYRFLPTTSQAA